MATNSGSVSWCHIHGWNECGCVCACDPPQPPETVVCRHGVEAGNYCAKCGHEIRSRLHQRPRTELRE